MANKKRIEEAYTKGYAAGLMAGNTSTLVAIRDWLTSVADDVPRSFQNITDKATQDIVSGAVRALVKVPAQSLQALDYRDPVDGNGQTKG